MSKSKRTFSGSIGVHENPGLSLGENNQTFSCSLALNRRGVGQWCASPSANRFTLTRPADSSKMLWTPARLSQAMENIPLPDDKVHKPFHLLCLLSRLVVWRMWTVQPQRDVLHKRAAHRKVERYQVALLQGSQLLASRHGHDDPSSGFLLNTRAPTSNCDEEPARKRPLLVSSCLISLSPDVGVLSPRQHVSNIHTQTGIEHINRLL